LVTASANPDVAGDAGDVVEGGDEFAADTGRRTRRAQGVRGAGDGDFGGIGEDGQGAPVMDRAPM
jgi:hypothetical protein